MWTFIIGAVVFLLMVLAIRSMIKTKKSGGSCTSCGGACGHCNAHCHEIQKS